MSEREQFEAWWRDFHTTIFVSQQQYAWLVWQAARAQTAQAVPLLSDDEIDAIQRQTNASYYAGTLKDRDHSRAIEQAVRDKLGVAQWQPISTAPKDGTLIDLWHSEFGRMSGCYWGLPYHCCGEMGSLCDSDWHSLEPSWVDEFNEPNSVDEDITHWMPLPPPPIVGKEGA